MKTTLEIIISVALLVFCQVLVAGSVETQRPNIIFIMADDLGYGDVHCYASESKIPTPHMDKLASEGVMFTDAHTAASVCTPSRYATLTGRYCWRSRLKKEVLWTTFDEPLIEKDRMTVASLLQSKGYKTACIGKWHLGLDFYKKGSDEFVRGKRKHHFGKQGQKDVDFSRPAAYSPNDVGFDFSYISGAGHNMEPHCFIKNRKPAVMPTVWREAKTATIKGSDKSESHEGWMSPGWVDENADIEFTKQVVKFIKASHKKDPNKPFFIYFTPCAPHKPCVPVEKFKGKSGLGLREDFVAQFDWCVGEVMKTLKELNLEGNTLLIVTSDNGAVSGSKGHKSAGKFRGKKSSLLEGGHRVPFIASWKGQITPGSKNDSPIGLCGLLASCAEMLETPLPDGAGEDSVSFWKTIRGKEDPDLARFEIIHHNYFGGFAIRVGDWKFIPKKSLYNIKDDPYELKNVYDEHPEKVQSMGGVLNEYREGKRFGRDSEKVSQ